MTGRHQYAESLDDWAELHGEPAPDHAGPEPDRRVIAARGVGGA